MQLGCRAVSAFFRRRDAGAPLPAAGRRAVAWLYSGAKLWHSNNRKEILPRAKKFFDKAGAVLQNNRLPFRTMDRSAFQSGRGGRSGAARERGCAGWITQVLPR